MRFPRKKTFASNTWACDFLDSVVHRVQADAGGGAHPVTSEATWNLPNNLLLLRPGTGSPSDWPFGLAKATLGFRNCP